MEHSALPPPGSAGGALGDTTGVDGDEKSGGEFGRFWGAAVRRNGGANVRNASPGDSSANYSGGFDAEAMGSCLRTRGLSTLKSTSLMPPLENALSPALLKTENGEELWTHVDTDTVHVSRQTAAKFSRPTVLSGVFSTANSVRAGDQMNGGAGVNCDPTADLLLFLQTEPTTPQPTVVSTETFNKNASASAKRVSGIELFFSSSRADDNPCGESALVLGSSSSVSVSCPPSCATTEEEEEEDARNVEVNNLVNVATRIGHSLAVGVPREEREENDNTPDPRTERSCSANVRRLESVEAEKSGDMEGDIPAERTADAHRRGDMKHIFLGGRDSDGDLSALPTLVLGLVSYSVDCFSENHDAKGATATEQAGGIFSLSHSREKKTWPAVLRAVSAEEEEETHDTNGLVASDTTPKSLRVATLARGVDCNERGGSCIQNDCKALNGETMSTSTFTLRGRNNNGGDHSDDSEVKEREGVFQSCEEKEPALMSGEGATMASNPPSTFPLHGASVGKNNDDDDFGDFVVFAPQAALREATWIPGATGEGATPLPCGTGQQTPETHPGEKKGENSVPSNAVEVSCTGLTPAGSWVASSDLTNLQSGSAKSGIIKTPSSFPVLREENGSGVEERMRGSEKERRDAEDDEDEEWDAFADAGTSSIPQGQLTASAGCDLRIGDVLTDAGSCSLDTDQSFVFSRTVDVALMARRLGELTGDVLDRQAGCADAGRRGNIAKEKQNEMDDSGTGEDRKSVV